MGNHIVKVEFPQSYIPTYLEKSFLPQSKSLSNTDPNKLLKQAIWAYFLLLIFEGALRKWLLPGLATPLLIVRDPLALFLVLKVWQRGLLPSSPYLLGTIMIGVLGVYTAILLGHGSLPVALFGARTLLIHFPLMFVIGSIFNRDDVVRLGKVTLWFVIPMTVLTALQFYSPQSAWVNRGVGGDMAGAGFSGTGDFFRPPGTFSFTNGLTSFYSFAAPFIFYFWFDSKSINKLLLVCASIGLLIAIPLSISRGLFFQVGVTVFFSSVLILKNQKYLSKFFLAIIGVLLALSFLSQTSFFLTATDAFTSRFETANENEGGLEGVLIDRYLGGMIGALTGDKEVPIFGYGLGMGTNVGSMLLTGGKSFLISEGEWGRLIGELGFLMGTAMIIIRLGFCVRIALASYSSLAKGDLLPWLLLSYGLLIVPQGQWAQPTSLGFSTLIGGLMLASLKKHNIKV
jgi:hypothetical protein